MRVFTGAVAALTARLYPGTWRFPLRSAGGRDSGPAVGSLFTAVRDSGVITALVLIAASVACGRSSNPTAPSPPVQVLAVAVSGPTPTLGTSVTMTATAQLSSGVTVDVTALVAWSTSAPMIATVSGGVVTAVAAGDVLITATYLDQPGTLRLTIAPTPPVGLTAFMRDYIESMMLGSGPLIPDDGTRGCPRFGNAWTAFPDHTLLQLVVSHTVPLAAVNALMLAVDTVNAASAGSLSITAITVQDADPIPATNQISVTMSANPLASGCGYPQGCTQMAFISGTSMIRSARAVLQTGQTPAAFVHDAIGHGALGLCHVDGRGIGSPGNSLMSFGFNVYSDQISAQLTDFDRLATTSVYRAGLARGAGRAEFLGAGLVNPRAAAVPHRSERVPDVVEIPSLRIR